MKYTIYKTTNDIDGKFYYGKHQTENPNDSYLGSGVHLERAISKYGREHFHKEVLFVFDTEEEMNAKEREIITEELISNPNCYNMTFGGEGGDTWSFCGRKHSNETKAKLREIALKKFQDPEYKARHKYAAKHRVMRMKLENPEAYAMMIKKRTEKILERRRLNPTSVTNDIRKKISASLIRHYDKIGRKNKPRRQRALHSNVPVCGKRITITNGMEELRVFVEEKDWYLKHGWILGASPLRKSPSEQAKLNSCGKGKLIIHNKCLRQVKRIFPDELDGYLKFGWERGYLNKKKSHNGGVE